MKIYSITQTPSFKKENTSINTNRFYKNPATMSGWAGIFAIGATIGFGITHHKKLHKLFSLLSVGAIASHLYYVCGKSAHPKVNKQAHI